MPSRAAAVQDGRRPPPQAAHSVLDGGEHDGTLTAATDDEAANATFKIQPKAAAKTPHTDLRRCG
jgi:hypothetical protein